MQMIDTCESQPAPSFEKELKKLYKRKPEELPLLEPDYAFQFCAKVHACGHPCRGVHGEKQCLPCANPECIETGFALKDMLTELLNESALPGAEQWKEALNFELSKKFTNMNCAEEELCGICYTCSLGEEPSVKLACGHSFHANCIDQLLDHRWTTLRITFGFLDCPSCKQEIKINYQLPWISSKLQTLHQLKEHIRKESVNAAIKEGYDKEGRVVDPNDYYYGRLEDFAMHNCTFYECWDCKQPYFGGMQDCEAALNAENALTKEDLKCDGCRRNGIAGFGKDMCHKHGNEFIDFKCMYCCSVAMFICASGRYYFCQPCHNDIMNGGKHKAQTKCIGGADCPLGVYSHPEAGDDPKKAAFALGCSLCRSNHLE